MIKQRKALSATLMILIANVVFFLVVLPFMYSKPGIITYIALSPQYILKGQHIWTFITSMFMHASTSHLIVNMLSLVFMGSFLERILGKKRFTIFYILSGIFAGVFFVLMAFIFKQDINALAVGASGALFGIGGLLAVLTPKLPIYLMFIPIPIPMWIGIVLSLGIMWLFSVFGANIGNTAHLGGLIAGLIYGWYLRAKYPRKVYMLNRFLGLKG
jgi:hypothetical protein